MTQPRSHWERLPRTRTVHCDACDEEHTLYRVDWIRKNEGRPGWPPWAAAKYRGWCPVFGDVADHVDRQGRFAPPAE